MQRTLYQLLGVAEDAPQDEIQRAYESRRSRLQGSADRGDVDASNQLKFVYEAFAVLRNPELRQQYDLKRAAKKPAPVTEPTASSSVDADSGEVQVDVGGDRIGRAAEHVRSFVQWHARSVLISAIGAVVVAVGFWQLWPTESNRLERRATQYLGALGDLNFEASRQLLTPELVARIPEDAYVRHYSQQSATTPKIVEVRVTEPSQRGYVITVSPSLTGGEAVKARLNWVKVDGQWYRDLAEDRPDLVKELTGTGSLVTADRALPVEFEFEELETNWLYDESGRTQSHRFAVWPETGFYVRNTGDAAIDYLQIMVEYYDTQARGVFASDTTYVIGSSDRPLQPGERSSFERMKSSVRYEMDFGQWANTLMAGPLGKDNPAIRRIEVRVYAKQAYDSQWTRVR